MGTKIRFQGFEPHTREMPHQSHANNPETLQAEARTLLRQFSSQGRKVRLVGLKVSDLRHEVTDQAPITNWLEEKRD